MKELKYLFYDTERSGNDHMVSIGCVVTDSTGAILDEGYEIIKPYKAISRSSVAIHGITTSEARKKGIALSKALSLFNRVARNSDVIGCYSASGDLCSMALACEHARMPLVFDKGTATVVDVAQMGINYMWERHPDTFGMTPSLEALYNALFPGREFVAHNALSDAKAAAECFWELMRQGFLSFNAILPYAKVIERCRPKKKAKSTKAKKQDPTPSG